MVFQDALDKLYFPISSRFPSLTPPGYSCSEGAENANLFFLAAAACAWKPETVLQDKQPKVPEHWNESTEKGQNELCREHRRGLSQRGHGALCSTAAAAAHTNRTCTASPTKNKIESPGAWLERVCASTKTFSFSKSGLLLNFKINEVMEQYKLSDWAQLEVGPAPLPILSSGEMKIWQDFWSGWIFTVFATEPKNHRIRNSV